MNTAVVVFLKEMRESLRDRRALLNALIVGPLLGPLLFLLILKVTVNEELHKLERPLPVVIAGAERAPNLIAALQSRGVEIRTSTKTPARAVADQDVEVGLVIDADYARNWAEGRPATVELAYDSSRREVSGSVARLRAMLEAYGRETGAMRLMVRGLSPSIAAPIVMSERDQATPETRGALLFGMLPYFLILTTFIGGMFLAIDLTAGERERQSLEPLFVNPVTRGAILRGKLMATSAFSAASIGLSLVAFLIVGALAPTAELDLTVDLGPQFFAIVIPAMLPLVLLVSALQTLVAAFARTLREAQTYLGLLQLVPVIPTLLMTVLPIKVQTWMYAIPIVGQQVAITRALRGDGVGLLPLLLTVVATLVALLAVYAVTRRVYETERIALSG
jgi:sodium transport system permease protein